MVGRDLLYKYFGQLELLELRFSEIKVSFTWYVSFLGLSPELILGMTHSRPNPPPRHHLHSRKHPSSISSLPSYRSSRHPDPEPIPKA